ncbi:MAG: hypothetical protein ACJA1R_000830 [Flavobacteriales bacterium]|jgi:hypothetical protein
MTSRTRPIVALLALTLSLAACGSDPAPEPEEGAITDAADAGTDLAETGVLPDTTDDTDEDTQGDADTSPEPDTTIDVTPDVGPPPRCETDAECRDDLTCTDDACVDGLCVWTLEDDACLINGLCFDEGDANPRATCEACAPSTDDLSWSTAEDGASCEDGSLCTFNTVCTAGVCEGEDLACDDGNACTTNACDPTTGCAFAAETEPLECDDGNACTADDLCVDDTCRGVAADCDDNNPCTADLCDETGACVSEPLSNVACDDGDACTTGDICDDGACGAGPPTNCDDGNTCTIDICDEFAGCSYLPNLNPCCTGTVSICDDGDPCTTDICDPASGDCFREENTAVCDDDDACTTNDSCTALACGGATVDCATDNPCAAAFCDDETGCGTTPLSDTPCDDGVACTVDDTCNAGFCEGISECTCEPTFGEDPTKVSALAIGETAVVRPEFCDRVAACADGVPNALNFVAGFANDSVDTAVADGSLVLLLDVNNIDLNPFEVALITGALDPANGDCDLLTETCDYLADDATLDEETCEPLVSLGLARAGNAIFPSGPPAIFPLEVPLGDTVLALTLYDVAVYGEINLSAGTLNSVEGLIAGAVRKVDLIAALQALPPDALPIDVDSILGLLDLLVVNDVDTTGDGVNDAATIALTFSSIAANIVGVAE